MKNKEETREQKIVALLLSNDADNVTIAIQLIKGIIEEEGDSYIDLFLNELIKKENAEYHWHDNQFTWKIGEYFGCMAQLVDATAPKAVFILKTTFI